MTEYRDAFNSRPAAELARVCIEHPEWYTEVTEPLFKTFIWVEDRNRYVVLPQARVVCFCGEGKKTFTLARIFRDPVGDLILWTSGSRGPINDPADIGRDQIRAVRCPPVATHLPLSKSDPSQERTATCQRCRSGRVLQPQVGWVADRWAAEHLGFGRVV